MATLRTGSMGRMTAPGTATHTMRRSMIDGFSTPINDIKPRLLESRVSESKDFFRLSDGFQKIFANDKKD